MKEEKKKKGGMRVVFSDWEVVRILESERFGFKFGFWSFIELFWIGDFIFFVIVVFFIKSTVMVRIG